MKTIFVLEFNNLIKVIHRVNQGSQLEKIPYSFGVEVDLRQWGNQIIVEHEPFVQGECFEEWLKSFHHKLIVLNIKSEGIEMRAVEMLYESFPEASYFLLDQSFPFLFKSIISKSLISGIRVSDIESFEQMIMLRSDWVWLDCHLGDWSYLTKALPIASKLGIKTCLASPELHGRNVDQEVNQIKGILNQTNMKFSAVCTKNPSVW